MLKRIVCLFVVHLRFDKGAVKRIVTNVVHSVLETHILVYEVKVSFARFARTMLGNDDFCKSFVVFASFSVVCGTLYEHNNVGILLNSTRFSQIAQHRLLAAASCLHCTRELRQSENGNAQLL